MLNAYPYATKELLLDNYSIAIFEHYFQPFELGRLYKSPLRQDEVPSFNIYKSRIGNGRLLYKDYGSTKGNAIDFVMHMHHMEFYDAIVKIVTDLSLPYKTKHKLSNIRVSRKELKQEEKSRTRNLLLPILYKYNGKPIYTEADYKYWLRDLKIPNIDYLIKHRIRSARELHIGGASVWAATRESPIYIFYEKYKDVWWRKAYRPFGEPGEKWRSDYIDAPNMVHGVDLLKGNSPNLIITKSVKDNVVLDSLGFEAIATQGEDMPFNKLLMEQLKKTFKNIYVLFDNDFEKEHNIGRELSNKFAEEHKIQQIIIPESYEHTDVSELIRVFEPDTLKRLINKWKK